MNTYRKLLIINHDFPPAGGAGIKRCLKFMKHLPEYGWQISVLTVKNGNHFLIDKSLLNEVRSDVTVYRALTFESIFNNRSKDNMTGINVSRLINGSNSLSTENWLKKAYKKYGQFVKVPDSRVLWIPAAMTIAVKLILRKQFDAIFATGPTFVNFIIAAFIKMLSKKPLVIDFRDAWLADPMLINETKEYLFKYHSFLEGFVLRQADKIISTNPFVTRDFQKRYNFLDPGKFLTIYNGYDVDDFTFMKEYVYKQKDKFTIVYTGRLYDERTPKHFLKALRMALDEKPAMLADTRVIFVGACENFLDGNTIEDYIKEYQLEDVVELTGHISRKESLEYQMGASLLLMLIGIVPPDKELTYGLSGKIFDYILSRKPILTLANGGATREFIKENKIGHIFFHEDSISIKNYLIEAYQKYQNGTLIEDYDLAAYDKFDFRLLSKTLSEQFNDLIIGERNIGNP